MMYLLKRNTIAIALSVATGSLLLFTNSCFAQAQESEQQRSNQSSSVKNEQAESQESHQENSNQEAQQENSHQDSSTTTKENDYNFAQYGRPGRRTSGGSRGECSQIDSESKLTALVPNANWGKTVNKSPNWWFYVPYSSQQTPVGAFVVQDKNYNDVYRGTFHLPSSTPGFVSVNLPKKAAPLKVDKSYRWQFNLYCSRDRDSAPIYVSGWIDVLSTQELNRKPSKVKTGQYQIYANQGIWFDTINDLAQQRRANPSDPQLAQEWQELLHSQGVRLEQLQDVPFSGSVKFTPTSQSQPIPN